MIGVGCEKGREESYIYDEEMQRRRRERCSGGAIYSFLKLERKRTRLKEGERGKGAQFK